MTVSAGYLIKIRRSVRRNASTDTDAELTDIIEECRLDLQRVGVISIKANDENDVLILGAIRCYARWKFGLSNEDAALNREDYLCLRDDLHKSRDYIGYAIAFTVQNESAEAIADASITFNAQVLETDANGQAVFYYVKAGTNQSYFVEASGYVAQYVFIDITATASVTVVMEAI
jgi:hypothetical protein